MIRTYYGTQKEDSERMASALAAYKWTMFVVVTGNPFDEGLGVFGPYPLYADAKEALEESGLSGWISELRGPHIEVEDAS